MKTSTLCNLKLQILFLGSILISFVKCSSENFSELRREELVNLTRGTDLKEQNVKVLSDDALRRNIVFHYFKDGVKISEDRGLKSTLAASGCLASDKFAFVIHGYGQDCNTAWVPRLREKLTTHRGGCIVCIDYGFYKRESYLRLLKYFRSMVNVITSKLQQLRSQGFDPNTGFIYGFSLGGQMATAIGKMFGPRVIKQIDTCDMAGPGFDFLRVQNHRNAAQQVTCWHTSRNKGTAFYACDENVRFGNCGYTQPGETSLITSHGLCNEYYINAFDIPFYASQKTNQCLTKSRAIVPRGYTVGYNEDIKSFIAGEIFVPTTAKSPYNLPLDLVLKVDILPGENDLIDGNTNENPQRRRFREFFQNAMSRLLQKLES